MSTTINMPFDTPNAQPEQSWWQQTRRLAQRVVCTATESCHVAGDQVQSAYNAAAGWVEDEVAPSVSKAYEAASQWTTETALPAVQSATNVTLDFVDAQCAKVAKAEVDFLVRRPGIAMLLSQQTVIRMAAAKHYDQMSNNQETPSQPKNVTSTME